MKSKIVIGNWKMNKSFDEAEDLITEIEEILADLNLSTLVVLAPPFPYLELATDHAPDGNFECAAQNCSQFNNGAYTGEVSASMLADIDVEFCIVGHSERRKYFNETNEILAEKVNRLTEVGLIPIYCCGETVEEREAGVHFDVIEKQIKEGLFHLLPESLERVIVAYEPVWAIGTGLTATPQQAEEVHLFIRSLIEKKYGTEAAYNLNILYGGSCNPSNALELFTQPNIDGGLIGGASLNTKEFIEIVEAAETAGSDK
ncbi:triose-phosphate isomerase [Bacteroidales bacterium OttesenSCG-928-B11]|nr:triose-phosphate isomerase [Bacteroidales bacterium OttesenSCG-928-B11]